MTFKRRDWFRPVIALVVLLAVLFGLFKWFTRPSLSSFQNAFGFSLDGIKVKIVDHYNEGAWQDNWSAYICRISGATEGSVFDPALMYEGMSPMIKKTLELNDGDRAAKGLEPFFKEKTDVIYKSRVLTEQGVPNPNSRTDRLFIIYSPSEELYYVFYETFVASN